MPSQKRADRMRNAATQEALRSTMRYRHGAIIIKGGKILAQGHNHVRTGFSGPLSAHEAIVLPMPDGSHEQGTCKTGQKCQSYFSMHAEMHAVTTALRGARPHMPRGGLLLDPMDEVCTQLQTMALEMPACSRFSDTSSTPAKRSTSDVKSQCDRALVEGAKREQQRVALHECKKNHRNGRVAAWDVAASGGGLWAGNQVCKRRRSEQQAERARRLAQRKEEKRARKARGARSTSSGGSSSSSSADSLLDSDSPHPPSDTSSSASDLPTPPSEQADTPSMTSATLALRKVARRTIPLMEDSRIRGADLYVVRLLQDTESKAKAKEQRRKRQHRRTGPAMTVAPAPVAPAPVVPRYADSRPCWRCLEWMYWAGIKRVFWTDTSGHWHGGKVSELLFGDEGSGSHVSYVPVHLTQYEHAAAMLRQRKETP
ncbi:hypothetical protein MNAN1_000389 [Malassezia nana]|uniref:CMP/dCMP-type deaminase domain-containing protein n=1 Tax=Malassezia nana TaxID=180528 RepID=A0AAF0ENR0_9BASI|nr:hypothetical protein MNAN1_000389 [Malassezia nana]